MRSRLSVSPHVSFGEARDRSRRSHPGPVLVFSVASACAGIVATFFTTFFAAPFAASFAASRAHLAQAHMKLCSASSARRSRTLARSLQSMYEIVTWLE